MYVCLYFCLFVYVHVWDKSITQVLQQQLIELNIKEKKIRFSSYIHTYMHLYIHPSIDPSTHPVIYPSIYPSTRPYIHMHLYIIYPLIHSFFYTSIHREIDDDICYNTNLQQQLIELNIKENKISELPTDIGQFTYLQTLDVSFNMLNRLPSSLTILR